VEHVDITSYDARAGIDAMRKMSLTSALPPAAADIFPWPSRTALLVSDHPAGSTAPAAACTSMGMVKYGMADVVVATAASIIDMDFFERSDSSTTGQAREVDDAILAPSC